jgi:hypothetical protein
MAFKIFCLGDAACAIALLAAPPALRPNEPAMKLACRQTVNLAVCAPPVSGGCSRRLLALFEACV